VTGTGWELAAIDRSRGNILMLGTMAVSNPNLQFP
jgi:hypothetical protein